MRISREIVVGQLGISQENLYCFQCQPKEEQAVQEKLKHRL